VVSAGAVLLRTHCLRRHGGGAAGGVHLLLPQYFLPPPDAGTFVIFVVSLVLTALLQFFISFGMAMLAFWLLEISTLIFILFAFEYLASGHLFPLDILPAGVKQILSSRRFRISSIFPSRYIWARRPVPACGRAGHARALGRRGLWVRAPHVAAGRQAIWAFGG